MHHYNISVVLVWGKGKEARGLLNCYAVVGLKRVVSSPKTTVTDSFVIAKIYIYTSHNRYEIISIHSYVEIPQLLYVVPIVVQTTKLVD